MKAFTLLVFILVPVAALAATSPISDGTPTVQEFEKKIGAYPYRATSERSQQIRGGMIKVTHCMTKSEIRALLGEPDYAQDLWPKDPNGKWIGTAWTYWIAKRGSGVNEMDPSVEVFFDTHGRAHWIAPRGIGGAKSIGGVKELCAQQSAPPNRQPAAQAVVQ